MKHRQKTDIIERLVKPESLNRNINKGGWAREVKLFNELLIDFPDETFWEKSSPGFVLHSLAWFKTPDGRAELSNRYKLFFFTLDTGTKSEYIGEKAGEDYQTNKKPKTVAELLQ